jgi:protein-disulfide isomerase
MTHSANLIAIVALLLVGCMPSAQLGAERAPDISSDKKQTVVERANELYHSQEDLVLGNPAGKVAIVEFFDYNCGYCKRALPEMAKLIESDDDVRVIIKEFPILGEGSLFAAKAALASAKQGKYKVLFDALNASMANKNETSVLQVAADVGIDVDKLKKDMQGPAVSRVLSTNRAIARSHSIDGTPSFIIGDSVLQGFTSYKTLSKQIVLTRARGGCEVC